MNKSALTLKELLVIIAIVATLACLALPILSQMKEKKRAALDLTNLHELGIATAAYVFDHDGQIFSSATKGGWPCALDSKYVANWKTFKSPFDMRPAGGAAASGAGVPVSYGVNVNILTQSSGGNAFDGKVAHYTSPSRLICMAPNVDLTQRLLLFIPGTGDSNVSLQVPEKTPALSNDNRGTHANRSRINVLYADYSAADISYRDYATASSPDGSGQARWTPKIAHQSAAGPATGK